MKKIPTLFVRNPDDRKHVLPEVTPGCEWVLAGEGVATRKYDGTCVMFDGERWWARREVKPGKAEPPGFVAVQHDETTGKTVGWEPAERSAFARIVGEAVGPGGWDVGTYELVGPKLNGNPEHLDEHTLVPHGSVLLTGLRTTYDGIRDAFASGELPTHWEGVVWHHPDGRMAKIKWRDFT